MKIYFKVCLLLNASLCQLLSNDHDPIYDMIAKRNSYHTSALYEKRDRSANDNDHALDLTKEWLGRAKSSQTTLKSRNPKFSTVIFVTFFLNLGAVNFGQL